MLYPDLEIRAEVTPAASVELPSTDNIFDPLAFNQVLKLESLGAL